MSADIPAVAFGVVRMETQAEPVDAQTASMRHAGSGNTARADIPMLIDSTVVRAMGGGTSRSAIHPAALVHDMCLLRMYVDGSTPKKTPAAGSCGRDERHLLLARGWCAPSIRRDARFRNIVIQQMV
ncbi:MULTISPECIES: hypothetical protein [Burkholderia]|uniref:hypothetical protein n=1 Tax=Burkholderia TaxID=32008 RepID=UPI0015A4F09B|nr:MULTISPECIES: hypothetical protein [Burkholderia]